MNRVPLSLCVILVAATAHAQVQLGRMHALLIGVADYNKVSDLEASTNDVQLVEKTLRNFCGCNSVRAIADDRGRWDQPDYGKIMAALVDETSFANEAGFESLFVFFAGHGVRSDRNGELFIAPDDYVPGLLEMTGIPITFIKDRLARCKNVKHKFLVLDSCHAAADPTGGELAASLGQLPGLITFASCQQGQTSIEWPQCQQGLFTYWFCIGLSGWADGYPARRRDHYVDTGELHAFSKQMVGKTLQIFAEREGKQHSQEPELLGVSNEPVIIAKTSESNAEAADHHLRQAQRFLSNKEPQAALREVNLAFDHQAWDADLCGWRGRIYNELFCAGQNDDHRDRAIADLDTAILLAELSHRPDFDLGALKKLRSDVLGHAATTEEP